MLKDTFMSLQDVLQVKYEKDVKMNPKDAWNENSDVMSISAHDIAKLR